jgi:HNH endonuclease
MARRKIPALDRPTILEAIRRAARKLGRAPTWNELRRITGVPESRVRIYFRTLADAITAAGLEPGRQGLRIDTEELLRDFARVTATLGRPPSRNEYRKEGKYSAGAFYARFGCWPAIERHLNKEQTNQATTEPATEQPNEADKAIALSWATTVPALPGDLAGKRRVTDAVCAMIVATLLGAESDWQAQLSRYLGPGKKTITGDSQELARIHTAALNGNGNTSLAVVNREASSGGLLYRDRPVMGMPFHQHALSYAPVNELGVVFLFGMLAGELGFQVDSLWGAYPDCEARRQIQPGKWQRVRIEIEYESVNFARHRHDPDHCDLIVCWKHNWSKCPDSIEVIELSRILSRSGDRQTAVLCPRPR